MADNYEFFYDGAGSSLDPESGGLFTGYRFPAGRIGAPTSPQTANQIQEVSSRLSEGIKMVELQPLQPMTFETIPKQHMQEINRLSKLTGSEVSVHAPMIDPAGFSDRGKWSESERDEAERQLWNVVERCHELNPKGNVPITVHASSVLAAEYKPKVEGEKEMIVLVNQDTGDMAAARREEKYYPEAKEKIIYTPEKRIREINYSEWENNFHPLLVTKQGANEMVADSIKTLLPIMDKLRKREITAKELTPEQQTAYNQLGNAKIYLDDIESKLRAMYNRAYNYGTDKDREKLKEVAKEWQEQAKTITEGAQKGKITSIELPLMRSQLIDKSIAMLHEINAPEVYKPLEDFAREKASQTLANISFKAYKKFKDNAPMVNVENFFPGSAFSRADELKKLIETSREEFVKKASSEGYSADEASQAADKLIGVTWDIGHINLLRKAGFGKEKIVEETKKIAPYVKHLHMTDNFGFEDSHLPVGMGDVPVKEMMKELEKAGYSGKAIMEAGGFVQHFKASPHPYVLEAMGSPLYSAYMQPFWNQARGTGGGYSSGYGLMLPDQHFSMYGSGFSSLPSELGGQVQGRSRFAGTPNE